MFIHTVMIDRYGGHIGVRDAGLIESVLAAPLASFGREPLPQPIPASSSSLAWPHQEPRIRRCQKENVDQGHAEMAPPRGARPVRAAVRSGRHGSPNRELRDYGRGIGQLARAQCPAGWGLAKDLRSWPP